MWSWGGRSSNGTQLVTMPGYAWGQATTDVNAGTVQALAEGTTWVKMYCPDTNINYTADVQVHFLEEGKEYYVRNRDSGMQLGVNNQNTPSVSFVWQEDEEFIPSQQFVFESVNKTTPYLYIKNVYSNLYLGVYDNSTAADQGLRLYNKDASADGQKFQVIRTTDNYFKISPKTGEGADPDMVLAPSGNMINTNLIMQKNAENNTKHEWIISDNFNANLIYVEHADLIQEPRYDYFEDLSDLLDNTYNVHTDFKPVFTETQMKNHMENSRIFSIITHGSGMALWLGDRTVTANALPKQNMYTWDLSKMDLALLVACSAGMGGYNPNNITNGTPYNVLETLVWRGAKTAVGFDADMNYFDGVDFGKEFMRRLVEEGESVNVAVERLRNIDAYTATASHVVVAGDGGFTIP